MLLLAPSGSSPMLGNRKSPPNDSYDSPFTSEETKAEGLGFGVSVSEATFF